MHEKALLKKRFGDIAITSVNLKGQSDLDLLTL